MPLSVGRNLLRRLYAYPIWVRGLLAPLVALAVLISPVATVLQLPAVLLRAIWTRLKHHSPFRQIALLLGTDVWRYSERDPPHPYDMLIRSRLARRMLLLLLIVEWSSLIFAGTCAGLLCVDVGRAGPLKMGVFAGLFSATLFTLPAWWLQAYIRRLADCWRSLDRSLCPQCGYGRDYAVSVRCPECGLDLMPVPPGYTPVEWGRWESVTNDGAVGLPVSLIGSLGFGLVVAARWIPLWVVGVLLFAVTSSLVTMAAIALWQIISGQGRMDDQHRSTSGH